MTDYQATVRVIPQVPLAERDADDRELQASYVVLFVAPANDNEAQIEAALDRFHSTIPVSCLEDFEFDVTDIRVI